MHLVFLNQYYPPDAAPTGMMLEAVVEELVTQGHRVTVFCAAGGYASAAPPVKHKDTSASRFVSGQLQIVRIGATKFGRGTFVGKLADYASYYVGTVWKLSTLGKVDRVVALTTPPYLSILARAISRFRGADHAHWVMDLYPDVMTAHGMMRAKSISYRLLQSLTKWGFGGKRLACLLTLGPDMAQAVGVYRPGSENDVDWVPLWASAVPIGATSASTPASVAMREDRGWPLVETVVMYSGNMGLGHLFDEVLETARILAAPQDVPDTQLGPFRFVFYGAGKRKNEIECFIRDHPGWNVELHDYVPASDLDTHLRTADVHLVSLRPEWTGTMVPSKLQGIFTVARAVIFIGDPSCSIGQWVKQSEGGWHVPPGSHDRLISILQETAGDREQYIMRGEKAAKFASSHFSQQRNVSDIASLLSVQRSHACVFRSSAIN